VKCNDFVVAVKLYGSVAGLDSVGSGVGSGLVASLSAPEKKRIAAITIKASKLSNAQ
jgi:hypothetical protein